MASTRSIRKRAQIKVANGNQVHWLYGRYLASIRARAQAIELDCGIYMPQITGCHAQAYDGFHSHQSKGVTIPSNSVVSIQDGDCWRYLNGPNAGCRVPMTEAEKEFARKNRQEAHT